MMGHRFAALLMIAGLSIAPVSHAGDFNVREMLKYVPKVIEATREVPEAREVAMGRQLAAGLLGAAPLVEDEGLQRYVNRVGRWLALQTDRPDLPWRFAVIDTGTANAFAAPGGYVFVTRGLLGLLTDESQLAGVLAHEIAHVTRQHHLDAMRKQAWTSIAVDLVGEVAGDQGKWANAVMSTGMELLAKGLDREDEYEADRDGVVIATRAGYRPWGLPATLETLDGLSAEDARVAFLFSTHPPPRARLSLLDRVMGERFDHLTGPAVRERFLHAIARLRAKK